MKPTIDLQGLSSDTNISVHTSAKLTQQYAAIAKLAWLFNPCAQFYAFIGPNWGNFKLRAYQNVTNSTTVLGTTINTVGTLKDEHNQFKAGLLVGVGLEQLLNPCTTVGLEYNYTSYRHLNFAGYTSTPFNLVGGASIAGTALSESLNARFFTNSMVLKFNYYYA